MRRLLRLRSLAVRPSAALGAALASAVIAATPVAANGSSESQVNSTLGSVSMSLRTPQTFIEAKCLFIPLEIAWTRRPDVTVVGELTVLKPGASVANADSFVLARSEPATGRYTDYVYVCPADGPGAYVLSGTATFIGADSSEVVAVPPIAFTVMQAHTSIIGFSLSRSGASVVATGRAVIAGEGIAAGGILVIAVREPGSTEWVNVAVPGVSSSGAFRAPNLPKLAPGTWIRAQVLKCKWCTGARAYARIR